MHTDTHVFPRTCNRFPGETIEVHHATLHRIGDLLFPGTLAALAGNQLGTSWLARWYIHRQSI